MRLGLVILFVALLGFSGGCKKKEAPKTTKPATSGVVQEMDIKTPENK